MVLALLTAWTLTAQTPDSVVRAEVLAAVMAMNDSLTALRGASAQFNRDLANASPELVRERAAGVRSRCLGATNAGARIDSVYQRHAVVVARDRGVPELRGALANLQRELRRCDREWLLPPRAASVDSTRAWGPHRLARLGAAVRSFTSAANSLPYPRPKPAGGAPRVGMRKAVDSHFHILWKSPESSVRILG